MQAGIPCSVKACTSKNRGLRWREVKDLMFWRRGWSGEREVNEDGGGVYILPPPEVTVPLCIRASLVATSTFFTFGTTHRTCT